jgi:hypothetical protein
MMTMICGCVVHAGLLILSNNDMQYEGVIALRLLGSHFLVIRTHTIELHAWNDTTQPMRPLKHRLPFPLREGGVSVSDPVITSTMDCGRHIRINAITYDTHSLASYAVAIFIPDVGAYPTMDVTLTGEVRDSPPPVHVGNPLTRSHWFVSALALGPQAIRAMWTERHSLTMARHVRLCSFNRNTASHEMNTAANVFTLSSYDLRGQNEFALLITWLMNGQTTSRTAHWQRSADKSSWETALGTFCC